MRARKIESELAAGVAPRDDVYQVWQHCCPQAAADWTKIPKGEDCDRCGATDPSGVPARFIPAEGGPSSQFGEGNSPGVLAVEGSKPE